MSDEQEFYPIPDPQELAAEHERLACHNYDSCGFYPAAVATAEPQQRAAKLGRLALLLVALVYAGVVAGSFVYQNGYADGQLDAKRMYENAVDELRETYERKLADHE